MDANPVVLHNPERTFELLLRKESQQRLLSD